MNICEAWRSADEGDTIFRPSEVSDPYASVFVKGCDFTPMLDTWDLEADDWVVRKPLAPLTDLDRAKSESMGL